MAVSLQKDRKVPVIRKIDQECPECPAAMFHNPTRSPVRYAVAITTEPRA